MKKTMLNLVVDSVIGLAFALSAASGVAFLLPQPASGVPTVLGLDLLVWSNLHTVASLGMVGGVLLHLALHARWLAATTRKTFAEACGAKTQVPVRRASCPTREASPTAKRGLA